MLSQPPPLPAGPAPAAHRSAVFASCVARERDLCSVGLYALAATNPTSAACWKEAGSATFNCTGIDPASCGLPPLQTAALLVDRRPRAEVAAALVEWVAALPGGGDAAPIFTAALADAALLLALFQDCGDPAWLVARWNPRFCRAGAMAKGDERAWKLQLLEEGGADASSAGFAEDEARALGSAWLRSTYRTP